MSGHRKRLFFLGSLKKLSSLPCSLLRRAGPLMSAAELPVVTSQSRPPARQPFDMTNNSIKRQPDRDASW